MLVTYRAKASSRGHVLGVFDQIKKLQLLQRSLAGGQPPGLGQDLHTTGTHSVVRDAAALFSSLCKSLFLERNYWEKVK